MYYKNYLKNLRAVCKEKNIKIISIGKIDSFFIYKIVLNPSGNKTVVFSAGIHGNEISGPLSIIEFLKKIDFKKYSNTKIIIFPVANPTGFDKNQRNNYLNKDLNRLFCKSKTAFENKILLKELQKEKIFFFHALHSDTDETSFYMYNFENKKEEIYRDLIQIAKKYFPIKKSKSIYGDRAEGGLIGNCKDGSFEDKMYREGSIYSICSESPEKHPLNKNIKLNISLMRKIIDFTNKQKY